MIAKITTTVPPVIAVRRQPLISSIKPGACYGTHPGTLTLFIWETLLRYETAKAFFIVLHRPTTL